MVRKQHFKRVIRVNLGLRHGLHRWRHWHGIFYCWRVAPNFYTKEFLQLYRADVTSLRVATLATDILSSGIPGHTSTYVQTLEPVATATHGASQKRSDDSPPPTSLPHEGHQRVRLGCVPEASIVVPTSLSPTLLHPRSLFPHRCLLRLAACSASRAPVCNQTTPLLSRREPLVSCSTGASRDTQGS